MNVRTHAHVWLLPLATVAALLLAGVLAAGGTAAGPGCASFRSQAEAQDHFVAAGGGPGQRVGTLDADGDGVACEDSPSPYKGYATIGYNRKGGFFYGTVTMPPATATPAAGEKFACLYGNRHFPAGPRLLRIYRWTAKGPIPISDTFGAEARPESSRLLWKWERRRIIPARYYAAFDERVPISPYGANECPGFSSAEVRLPPPLKR